MCLAPKWTKSFHLTQNSATSLFILASPWYAASMSIRCHFREPLARFTHLTSRICPVPTSKTYPMIGISRLTYGEALREATSERTFVETSPGEDPQPVFLALCPKSSLVRNTYQCVEPQRSSQYGWPRQYDRSNGLLLQSGHLEF